MSESTIIKLIVVGVDGSDGSAEALRRASRLASITDSKLRVVSAWMWPSAAMGGAAMGGVYVDERATPEDDAKTIIDITITKAFGDDAPDDLERVAIEGPAAKALISGSEDAGLLVVGSRGHGGVAGLLLGSVSAECAEHAKCPVLVVHGEHEPTFI